MKTGQIIVQDKRISIIKDSKLQDYISLTDMLKAKDGDFFISDWLRNRNTVEYLGMWEKLNNPNFNYGEFTIIKSSSNLENINADLIRQVLPQPKRLTNLNKTAIYQMKSLLSNSSINKLT